MMMMVRMELLMKMINGGWHNDDDDSDGERHENLNGKRMWC